MLHVPTSMHRTTSTKLKKEDFRWLQSYPLCTRWSIAGLFDVYQLFYYNMIYDFRPGVRFEWTPEANPTIPVLDRWRVYHMKKKDRIRFVVVDGFYLYQNTVQWKRFYLTRLVTNHYLALNLSMHWFEGIPFNHNGFTSDFYSSQHFVLGRRDPCA